MSDLANASPDTKREMLRHTLATLVYRCAKVLKGAPEGFGATRADATSRTPLEILAHVNDLLDWALHMARGAQVWKDSTPQSWDAEIERFFAASQHLDEYLGSGAPLGFSAERLFQGPIADALTHTGQLAMLCRLAGAPVRGENYFKADIVAGRVGAEQSQPRGEFD
ncbi:MAG: hypothetical protein QOF61_2029 [Acidobacteriota bacterium]|jgi:hypothetical protein|nr:hypothetical protein [Acidobacteriota bacterium]